MIKPQQSILQRISDSNLSWPLVIFFSCSILQSTIINKVMLFAFIVYLFFSNSRTIAEILKVAYRAWPLLILTVWDLISISWSFLPQVTLINVINDLEIYLFCLFLAMQSTGKDIAKSLKYPSMVIILAVLIFSILFYGTAMSPYGLRAFYNHKNNLGFAMALCILIIVFSNKMHGKDYFFVGLGAVLLFLSESKTSMNLLMLILCMGGIAKLIRHGFLRALPSTQSKLLMLTKAIPFLAYCLIVVVFCFREEVATYLISAIPDDAITGRGLLWRTLLTRVWEHMVIGIGPGVFWGAGVESEIAQMPTLYIQSWVKELHAADGGYIDIVGSLGFIGLSLLLVWIVFGYQILFRNASHPNAPLGFALVTFFVFHNITETDVFRFVDAPWFLFQFLTFYFVLQSMDVLPSDKRLHPRTFPISSNRPEVVHKHG